MEVGADFLRMAAARTTTDGAGGVEGGGAEVGEQGRVPVRCRGRVGGVDESGADLGGARVSRRNSGSPSGTRWTCGGSWKNWGKSSHIYRASIYRGGRLKATASVNINRGGRLKPPVSVKVFYFKLAPIY
jgi:hypothetical protein